MVETFLPHIVASYQKKVRKLSSDKEFKDVSWAPKTIGIGKYIKMVISLTAVQNGAAGRNTGTNMYLQSWQTFTGSLLISVLNARCWL